MCRVKCGFKASSKPWKVSLSLFLFCLFISLLLGDQMGRSTSVTKLPQVELDCKGGEEALIFKASRIELLSRILKSLIKVGYPSRFKSFLSV